MAIVRRTDFVSPWIIERAAALAPAVGRVVVNDGRGFGTGVLVAPQIVLTCHHVIPDVITAMSSAIEFDYRDDPSGRFHRIQRVAFNPSRILTNPELDFSLLGLVDALPRVFVPLMPGVAVPEGQPVSLIHHPQAGPLKIGFQDGEVTEANDAVIHHTAGSLPGSAGAPLFDQHMQLVGLHHASVPVPRGSPTPVNEAIRIDAICQAIAASGIAWAEEAMATSAAAWLTRSAAPTRTPPPSPVLPIPPPAPAMDVVEPRMEQRRTTVFVSYARDDQPEGQWRERLRTFLQPLAASLDIWDDSRIQTGAQWRAEIDLALRRARVAVLLVGPHFLASEFIAQNELPPLLDAAAREAVRIMPLVTNECSYSRTALSRYQTFNNPEEPLEGLERARQNRVLRQFAEQISDAVGTTPVTDRRTDL